MTSQSAFIGEDFNGEPTFTIGQHDNIPRPVFIPEAKWGEGFRAILDYKEALDNQNPIMVPAAAYQGLRNKRNIANRKNEEGKKEVEILEANHPLIYFDPPELYNFRRTSTLRKYYFKGKSKDEQTFKSHLQEGNHDEALELLPQFQSTFVKANFDRVVSEISGAVRPRRAKYDIDSTDEAWESMAGDDMSGYFKEIATDTSGRSSTIIPPVPLLGPNLESSLVTAHCTANSKMAEVARTNNSPESYYHIYLKHSALRPTGEDAGVTLLDITEKELERSDYAGIALTIRNPHKLDAAGSLARAETFVKNLVQIAEEFQLPVIAPRSEWLGSLMTDNGVAAYSDLMNSAWEYRRDSSKGGIDEEWKKYGKVVAYRDAKRLVADPTNEESIIDYVANGKITEFEHLPNTPPGDLSSGETLEQILGTPENYRVKFSKPRKLSHIYEAKKFREDRKRGVQTPAREYLKSSNNQYINV